MIENPPKLVPDPKTPRARQFYVNTRGNNMLQFKDVCPARGECMDSWWCLCGDFGLGVTGEQRMIDEKLSHPYVPLFIGGDIKMYTCRARKQ